MGVTRTAIFYYWGVRRTRENVSESERRELDGVSTFRARVIDGRGADELCEDVYIARVKRFLEHRHIDTKVSVEIVGGAVASVI